MLQTFTGKVAEIIDLAENVNQITFQLINPDKLIFNPGQYLLLKIGEVTRIYSISSSPNKNNIVELLVDYTPNGIGSKYLKSLKVNDQVSFRAPLGVFTLKNNSRPKIFLTAGTGIAPIKSMLDFLHEQKSKTPSFLYWGARDKKNSYLYEYWLNYKKNNPQFNFFYCLSREETNDNNYLFGYIQNCFQQKFANDPNINNYDYYICARPEIVEAVKETLISKLNINKEFIFHEKFT